jgi:hypothetical protein
MNFFNEGGGVYQFGGVGVNDNVHGMHGEVSLWVCVICSTGGRRRE